MPREAEADEYPDDNAYSSQPGENLFDDDDDDADDDDDQEAGGPTPLTRGPLNMEQGIWHAPRGPKTRAVAWLILMGMAASIIVMIVLAVMALTGGG